MTEKEFNQLFAENLNFYMATTGTSRSELAKLLNVSVTSVANWCNALKTPRMDKVDRMCSHFGIKRSDLMSEHKSDHAVASAPIYEVAAGQGRISSTPTGTMNIQLRDDQFLATVKGRSMEPTLFDGDTVVIDRQSVPDQDGQIVMVKVDGEENTLKRVQIGENGITLIADNPSVYPTKFYTAEQVKDLPVQIMGVVTKLIRDI